MLGMYILVDEVAGYVDECVPCDVTKVTASKSESKAEARACRAAERSAGYSGARTSSDTVVEPGHRSRTP